MRELFNAFRTEVIALNPCVTEEFLKLYVAYKAETNFVDVIPQAKRLRLSLNTRFHEMDDPRGMCKDVSGLGRWGMVMSRLAYRPWTNCRMSLGWYASRWSGRCAMGR
jgi:predicted transport protein